MQNNMQKNTVGRPSQYNTASVLAGLSALVVLILLVLSSSLQAQQMTADVVGTVTDATGAVLTGAKVTIRNTGTGDTRTATTDDRGDYVFNLLAVGHYSMTVTTPRFKSYSLKDFSLSVGDRTRLNVKMELGAVSETVEVSAEAAVLQTETSSVSNTVGEKSIQDLPLNGRNYLGLVQLTPGITPGSGQQAWSYVSGGRADDRRTGNAISANGKSDQLNNNQVDGFDNNERSLGTIGLRPSMDGIQEVRVDTSSYSAEYGRAGGAIANVITKSGSNALHGSAFEYLRNDKLDSWEYFAKHVLATNPNAKKPVLRWNEFGGSLGGPIKKDKTFFFADAEFDRHVQGLTYSTGVPTAYELDHPGDFSDIGGLCPPGPPPPGGCLMQFTPTSQIALNYWKLFPHPNFGSSTYISYPSKVQNTTTVDGRLDHRFTSNDLFFARYAYNPVHTNYPSPFPFSKDVGVYANGNLQSAPSIADATSQQAQFTYTHIFNSNLLAEFKAGYTRINIQALPSNYGLSPDAKMGFPSGVYDVPGIPWTNTLTAVNLGINPSDPYLGDPPSVPLHNVSNNYQYAAAVTYTKGAHNFKFGGGYIRRQIQYIQTGFPQGMFIYIPPPFFNSFANLLADAPGVVIRMVQMVKPLYLTSEPSFYVSDNWRLKRGLTLNLGLRYELFTPYSEAHGQYSNFDLAALKSGTTCTDDPNGCFIMGSKNSTLGVSTHYKNISPRIGFAKSFGDKTVLRGAFGMTFFPGDTGFSPGGPNLVQMVNPPYFFNYGMFPGPGNPCINLEGSDGCVGLPVPGQIPVSEALSNPQVTSVFAKNRDFRPSYLEQWNLSIQREIGANTITVAYVGDVGRQLLRQVNADTPAPPCTRAEAGQDQCQVTPSYLYPASQIGPYITAINQMYNGTWENYNALQLAFNRRVTKGLGAGANYVYAHALSSATYGRSNQTAGMVVNDTRYDYGNADLDVRHRITFHLNYALPFAASAHGIGGVLAKGWQVNALTYWQTGMPFTVVSQATLPNRLAYINLPGVQTDRPDQVASAALSHPTVSQWFNVNAFAPQPVGTPGNEGVNQVVGPRDRRFDLSFIKDFTLRENMKLQFRAECFNLTNTANFAPPNNTITSWAGNQPDLSNGFGQINSTAFTENPRQFQFALKLLF